MKRRIVVALMFAFAACGGETSRDGASGGSGASGTSGASGASGDGGASGTGIRGSGGSGGIDCTFAGCAMPPLCSEGCQAPCGCCPCAPGQTLSVGPVTHWCTGGCFAPETPCESDADCPVTSYCDSSGRICRDDGTCLDSLDCDRPGNTYTSVGCVGSSVCNAGFCDHQCGGATGPCRNLAGVSFGNCEAFLGWAVVDGSCTAFSGCGPREHTFFASESECRATCVR